MEKIDLKKELKHLFKASTKKATTIEVPAMNFLMIDGAGDPNTSRDFQEAIEALYGASYTAKFNLKKSGEGPDYAVMPLEGLWWTDDMGRFSMDHRDIWKWTLMIMQPDFVTKEVVNRAMDDLRKKKNPPALSKMRLKRFDEGLSTQIMHKGPYSEEGPTVAKLHKFIEDNGYKMNGKHHEIYMGDPRRCKPDNLKTILRQPVRKYISSN